MVGESLRDYRCENRRNSDFRGYFTLANLEEMSESKTYECILVEFVNESESYGVGFVEWLLDEELIQDTEKLEHAIALKSETSIKWPVSCDPLTAKKKADCEFKKHVVIVYGFGGKFFICCISK